MARTRGRENVVIEPGNPGENGYNESFNGTPRYELWGMELFDTLLEAKLLIDRWRIEYNTIPPHSSLGDHPPAIPPWSESARRSLPTEYLFKEGDLRTPT